jgi:hypothetical protein
MALAEILLLSICANPSNMQLQACQAVAQATYQQNKQLPGIQKLDELGERLTPHLSPEAWQLLTILEVAINRRLVYRKEF